MERVFTSIDDFKAFLSEREGWFYNVVFPLKTVKTNLQVPTLEVKFFAYDVFDDGLFLKVTATASELNENMVTVEAVEPSGAVLVIRG